MDEAERCSRVGLLYRGRLIVCDTPERIRQMLEGELIEVRTTNLRHARQAVIHLDGVLEVQTYGDLLHVFVDDASRRMSQINDGLVAAGISTEGIRTTRPRMEEAFISLIRKVEIGGWRLEIGEQNNL